MKNMKHKHLGDYMGMKGKVRQNLDENSFYLLVEGVCSLLLLDT